MKKTYLVLAVIALVFSMAFIACSDGGDDSPPPPAKNVYVGYTSDGKKTVLTITEGEGAKALITNGSYTLEIAGTLVSSGAVSGGGTTLTFTPASGKPAFTATVSGGASPDFTGSTITTDTGATVEIEVAEIPAGVAVEVPPLGWLDDATSFSGTYTFPTSPMEDVYQKDGTTSFTPTSALTFQSYYDDIHSEKTKPGATAKTISFLQATVSTGGKLSSLILMPPDWTKVDTYYDQALDDEFAGAVFTPAAVKIKRLEEQDFHPLSDFSGGLDSDAFKYRLMKKKIGDWHGVDGGYVQYWYAEGNATVTGRVTFTWEGGGVMEYNVFLKKGWNTVMVTTHAGNTVKFTSGIPGSEFKWEVYYDDN